MLGSTTNKEGFTCVNIFKFTFWYLDPSTDLDDTK